MKMDFLQNKKDKPGSMSKAWLTYMQKRQSTIDHKEGKSVNQDKRFKNLLRAVVAEIIKTGKFSGKELEKLTDDIWERFEGMEN